MYASWNLHKHKYAISANIERVDKVDTQTLKKRMSEHYNED